MSVGSIKKFLFLANVVAVLAISGTAYGFWSHSSYMGEAHDWPKFKSAPKIISEDVGQMGNINIPLGKYAKKVVVKSAKPEEAAEEEIVTVIDSLGTITSAIVLFGPYGETSNVQPAITFKLKPPGQGTLTLSRGEAIKTKPDPVFGKQFQVNFRYEFVGCEPVEGDPTAVYFLFDMACDGKDIQKKLWKGDVKTADLETASGPLASGDGTMNLSGKNHAIIDESEITRRRKARADARKAAKTDKPIRTEPLKVNPDQVLPTAGNDAIPDSLFEEENGTFGATTDGAAYLEKNWKKVIEDAKTSTYLNPETGKKEGMLIRSIKKGSVAGKLGIYQDDVIKMINGRAVRSRSDAIRVIRDEIENAKRKVIEITLLRNGKSMVKRYDTQDPETRRAARSLR